jgi:hypothetical protein
MGLIFKKKNPLAGETGVRGFLLLSENRGVILTPPA